MRSIKKGPADTALKSKNKAYQTQIAAGTAKGATDAWRGFKKSQKQGTIAACMLEQIGLCAFSETVLDSKGWGYHLDHVIPKALNQSATFEHDNLVLSAFSSDALASVPRDDVFGGHHRGNMYSASDFINPLWSDSRRYFHCSVLGVLGPATGLDSKDALKVEYTIRILNLNSKILKPLRQTVLKSLEEQIAILKDDREALKRYAKAELCSKGNVLPQFHSAVRERFDGLGQSVLMANCPNCD